jgi:hypothetical protein
MLSHSKMKEVTTSKTGHFIDAVDAKLTVGAFFWSDIHFHFMHENFSLALFSL